MFKHHKKISKLLALAFILTVFLTGGSYISRNLSFDALKEFIISQGVFGQVFYILYLIVSTIFAPLTSLPLWPIVLVTYGFWPAVTLTFVGNFSGGMANFFIARIFGREVIHKIAGSKILKQIDEFTEEMGWKSFLLLRILGNISFDVVSYAVGLTDLKARIYLAITLVTQFIWVMGAFFLLDRAIALGRIPSLILTGIVYFLAIYGGIELWRRHHHHE